MGINEKDFLSYQALHESYNKRILLVLVSLSKLVWGLAKIRIWELSDEPMYSPLCKTLNAATDSLINHLKELGVDTSGFEEFDIKVQSQENPNN